MDMGKVTSSHTYQKGSWILHMLRGVVGTGNFWTGIRSYYKKYQDKNATTADFLREMEEASGMELDTFFRQWLNESGELKYEGSWTYNTKKGEVTVKLDQVQTDGSVIEMPVDVGIYFEDQNTPQIEVIQVNEKSNEFTVKVEKEPTDVVLDPNTWVLMEADFKKGK